MIAEGETVVTGGDSQPDPNEPFDINDLRSFGTGSSNGPDPDEPLDLGDLFFGKAFANLSSIFGEPETFQTVTDAGRPETRLTVSQYAGIDYRAWIIAGVVAFLAAAVFSKLMSGRS